MNLLPFNASTQDQKFAEMIDNKMKLDLDNFNINPLTCDISLLEHIALIKGANIENMKETEIREFLHLFLGEAKGTVGAVEKASQAYFNNTSITEWFKREYLKEGEFEVSVNVENQKRYTREIFDDTTNLVLRAKNVRSEFTGYEMLLEDVNTKNSLTTGSILNISLSNELLLKATPNLNIGGTVVWTI